MKIRSQLIKDGPLIPYRIFNPGGREHYNIRIYVDASPEKLHSIELVEYQLHPSFPRPKRRSFDRDSRFAIEIWTWGLFEIAVKIHFRNGESKEMSHDVKYDLPPDSGTNYVQV